MNTAETMTMPRHHMYRALHSLYLAGAFAATVAGVYAPASGGLGIALVLVALNASGCAAYLGAAIVIRATAQSDRIMRQFWDEIRRDYRRASLSYPFLGTVLYTFFLSFLVTTEQYGMAWMLFAAPCMKQSGDYIFHQSLY